MAREYVVDASWDNEAKVFVATSDDVPGLATEAESEEALFAKLKQIVPELLELNAGRRADDTSPIPLRLRIERRGLITAVA